MKREYSAAGISEWIDDYIHNERDRNILKDRFIEDMPFKLLEDKYHLSDRHIKRIVKKADGFFIRLK
jgi:DNA-directed RNA polymerase specialized sigma subunit